MNHAFDVAVASKYGVPIAIFLNNIAHWTSVNMANRRNYHDGRYWIYNTRKSFAELFPYWSEDQIRTISKKAKNFDLLLESNYNKHGYDKTIWYSLTDKSLSIYKLFPISPDESDSLNNDENPGPASFGKITKSSPASCGDFTEHQNEQIYEQNDLDEDKTRPEPAPRLIWEKSQMDLGKIPNGSGENPKPIPDVNPDGKTDTTTTIDQILTKDRDSEPVVVFNTSLTSTPTPTPIGRERQEWTEKLSVIYKPASIKSSSQRIILVVNGLSL